MTGSKTKDRPLDLICMGRAAVDLYGEQVGGRLEDMTSFAKYLGGCPANVAVGAARLGLKAAMLTRVGDEHMGRFLRETLSREGVDISHVATDPGRLTGLAILGIRDEDTFPLVFYRENCADMGLAPEDFDARFIGSAGALLVTGTHFSTPGTDRACRAAIACAKEAGSKVVLDIDYRPVLWGLTAAGLGEQRFVASDRVSQHLQTIVPLCDLVVGTEEEMHIAGGNTDTIAALRRLRSVSTAVFVVKRGPHGCTIFAGAIPDCFQDATDVPGFAVEVLNVLGAGDGFLAGFLSGWLRGASLERAGILANACGALVVSRHGCAPAMPSAVELEHFLARAGRIEHAHADRQLSHLHRATTGREKPKSIAALAFDHRRQLEELARVHGADGSRIAAMKLLIAEALLRFAPEQSGAIVDDGHGRAALRRLTGTGRWLARPVERPGSRPLEFEGDEEVAIRLRAWPAEHVVKCLVHYSTGDPDGLRAAQEAKLRELQRACHATGHRLMLEVIPPGWEQEPASVAAAVERLYAAGLLPDWWKLPPVTSRALWRDLNGILAKRDPQCGGVLILGLERRMDELSASFEAAASEDAACGLAIGRSVFRMPADHWLRGEINDAELISQVASAYASVLRAWNQAAA
jgi:5-dehydro-2-deoxygluconokinase